jgi:hypothetical protein
MGARNIDLKDAIVTIEDRTKRESLLPLRRDRLIALQCGTRGCSCQLSELIELLPSTSDNPRYPSVIVL